MFGKHFCKYICPFGVVHFV
ncbi:4Fe-4S binding protein [Sphingobacterium siyangense]